MTDNNIHAPVSSQEFRELSDILRNGKGNFSRKQHADAFYLHPLNERASAGTSYSALAPFVFRCSCCTDINFSIQWYKIIVDTLGGTYMDQKKSFLNDLQNGFNGSNLSKLLPDDTSDYQSSSLHFIKGEGYVCDHCMGSVYSAD
jgi:hypothetical protein